MTNTLYRTAKLILASLFLIILYLFALNSRYQYHFCGNGFTVYIFDKWTSKYVYGQLDFDYESDEWSHRDVNAPKKTWFKKVVWYRGYDKSY